ncbi:beta-lactamase-like protein [Xylariales sp. PMI_506]|nr:beta-lactamase-like protein [Xylariales sp. PMI_506]
MRLKSALLFLSLLVAGRGHDVAVDQTSTAYPVETYLPLPPGTDSPPLNSDGYRYEYLGAGAWMITNNQYQCMAVVSTEGVIVLDAPPTIGYLILWALGNITTAPVTHFVYSHAHADHTGGSYLLGNVTRISHYLTKEFFELDPDPHRPPPDITFSSQYLLMVGNQTINLDYYGANHQPGNIHMYHAASKTLMLVDIAFPGYVCYGNLAQSDYIPGFMRAHDKALEYDFESYVGGHLTRKGNRTDVQMSRDYIYDLYGYCREAFDLGSSANNATNNLSSTVVAEASLAANPGNYFAVLKEILGTYAQYCNQKTNDKWASVLGAADVQGYSNALKMVDYLRLDFDVFGFFLPQNLGK